MNIYVDGSYHPLTGRAGAAAVIDDGKAVRVVRKHILKCSCSNDAEFAALLLGAREATPGAIIYLDHIGWSVKAARQKSGEFYELQKSKGFRVQWKPRNSLPLMRQAHLQASAARRSDMCPLHNPVLPLLMEEPSPRAVRRSHAQLEKLKAKVARMLEDEKRSYESAWIPNKEFR